ncbi:MAG TPA: 2Fe-2S iron-sulfur cluster-binding protein [Desulfobacterales bacterium]|nr:2Fe-2S iron-sulfur cluster-binding protein [Desulfobacterales bacterium]
MPERTVEIRILRYKPGVIDPPRFETFRVSVGEGATVLDALERIRREQDPGLMYRHSCHHSSCGSCACRVDGVERLACTTPLQDPGGDTITIEPLRGFPVLGDLVVDMRGFYADIDPAWDCLRLADPPIGSSAGEKGFRRLEDCIECGACVSVCPAYTSSPGFMGPAVLAAANAERLKHPEQEPALLALAGSERGEVRCERALRCSRVCPTGVYPARHIMELRRRLRSTGP